MRILLLSFALIGSLACGNSSQADRPDTSDGAPAVSRSAAPSIDPKSIEADILACVDGAPLPITQTGDAYLDGYVALLLRYQLTCASARSYFRGEYPDVVGYRFDKADIKKRYAAFVDQFARAAIQAASDESRMLASEPWLVSPAGGRLGVALVLYDLREEKVVDVKQLDISFAKLILWYQKGMDEMWECWDHYPVGEAQMRRILCKHVLAQNGRPHGLQKYQLDKLRCE